MCTDALRIVLVFILALQIVCKIISRLYQVSIFIIKGFIPGRGRVAFVRPELFRIFSPQSAVGIIFKLGNLRFPFSRKFCNQNRSAVFILFIRIQPALQTVSVSLPLLRQ